MKEPFPRYKRSLRIALAVPISVLSIILPSQGQDNSNGKALVGQTPVQIPLSGTVNVFLANKNGLVAVTDSQLTGGAHFPKYGPKLFRIDPSTICTIAGWYGDPGPSFSGNNPASALVPDVMRLYESSPTSKIASTSLQSKMDQLVSDFVSTISIVARIEVAEKHPVPTQPLELTMAGFDGDKLTIIAVDLTRATDGSYKPHWYPVILVGSRLVYTVRGIPDVARPILDNPVKFDFTSDPILQMFSNAMKVDKGESLTLDDMKKIAKRLEQKTAEKCGGYVGGGRQIAVLADGKVSLLEQPGPFDQLIGYSHLIFTSGNGINASDVRAAVWSQYPLATLVTDGEFQKLRGQPLDDIFFIGSKFDHCVFTYSGGPFIFDRSNTVTRSILVLMTGANSNTPQLLQFEADFPNVKVIDKTANVESLPLTYSFPDK